MGAAVDWMGGAIESAADGTTLVLEAPTSRLAGVGPVREGLLARMGIECVGDLALFVPRRLVEWPETISVELARGRAGQAVRVRGLVEAARLTRYGGRRSTVRLRVADESGAIDALFFNQPWMRNQVVVGESVELVGKVVAARGVAMVAPRIGRADRPLPLAGSLIPDYRSGEGIGQDLLRSLIERALECTREEWQEHLPDDLLERLDLVPLPQAVRSLHDPRSRREYARARRRIALAKLLRFQASLQARRRRQVAARVPVVADGAEEHRARLAALPYTLTDGQARALREIDKDLASGHPMHRLLQGDVGCGKTLVLAWAAIRVASAGGQVAFMAPTEVLAEQHHDSLAPMLEQAGLGSDLLTSSCDRRQRRSIEDRLAKGELQIVFGTHALLSRSVTFRHLALAIIDEQQRFGVEQRMALMRKGAGVHLLLCTATPIPRTLAMTLYGDLDLSLIRDLPPGRGRTKTSWLRGQSKKRLLPFLIERLRGGESVFWICPRLHSREDEEQDEVAQVASVGSAERRHALLSRGPLAQYGIELVHGRQPRQLRARRLQRFREGRSRVLVATTVIEVGVDVPSATVLIVESAECLGLSQLHQLRGRVGRGGGDSWCFLLGRDEASERLRFLEREGSGFVIAEEDLRLRGMGDLAGLRQAGENGEGLQEPEVDLELLFLSRDLVRDRPELVETLVPRLPEEASGGAAGELGALG